MHDNKYTQRAWDRIVGIGKVPKEYAHKKAVLWNSNGTAENKLEEYKRKINYDVWEDVIEMNIGSIPVPAERISKDSHNIPNIPNIKKG